MWHRVGFPQDWKVILTDGQVDREYIVNINPGLRYSAAINRAFKAAVVVDGREFASRATLKSLTALPLRKEQVK